MRGKKRLVVEGRDAVYHVVCRTAFHIDKINDESKSVFVGLLKKQAEFAGVEMLTYCLLNNHFHILIRVPCVSEVTDRELVRRYRVLYGEEGTRFAMPAKAFAELIKSGNERAHQLRKSLLLRMHNLPSFVKELKQRFGIWFNQRHQNSGTLWSDRYHSVLVENEKSVIDLVGAYIEMNPVRAGWCDSPASYRFSGKNYAEPKKIRGEKISAELLAFLSSSAKEMSCGKVIGSDAFVRDWKAEHQSTLSKKSRWGVKCIIGLLSIYGALCDYSRLRP